MNVAQIIRNVNRTPEVFIAGKRTPAYGQLLLRYLDIGSRPYPFDVPLKSGGSLTLASMEEVKVFWNVIVRRSYVLPERCETILDCGANVGIFSVWAAAEKPQARIVALEPFPETFAALETNIRRNLLAGRVECAQIGLASCAGEEFMRTEGESPNRRMVLDEDAQVIEATVSVPCITLAECLRRFDIDTLDMLKMDIEGSEWPVLLSTSPAALRRIRYIQLEYHEVAARFGYTPQRLFSHLAAAGHRLTFRTEDQFHTGMAIFERR
jgi:FkbM family methyltransferase